MLGLLIALLWGAVAVAVYRRDPPPHAQPADPALRGIRGWLLLPALGVVVTPIRVASDLYSTTGSFSTDTWSQIPWAAVASGTCWPLAGRLGSVGLSGGRCGWRQAGNQSPCWISRPSTRR